MKVNIFLTFTKRVSLLTSQYTSDLLVNKNFEIELLIGKS